MRKSESKSVGFRSAAEDVRSLARLERNQKGRWAGGCGVERNNRLPSDTASVVRAERVGEAGVPTMMS